MLQSAVIEVIIGMVFMYILLSLLVSQINTVVANLLNIRAEQLRKRLEDVVFDNDLQTRLLAHPVVGIIRPTHDGGDPKKVKTERVSQLDPTTFTKALVNVLSDPYLNIYSGLSLVKDKKERERLSSMVNQLKANANDPTRANAILTQLHETITQMEPADRPDRRALLRTLGPLQSSIRNLQMGNSGLATLLDGVSRVENVAFQRAMETVLAGVTSIDEARLSIEQWYDQKMSQTKDMYGRTMQYLSLLVGLLLALFLNIDSLHIAGTLWNDPALRATVSAAAESVDIGGMIQETDAALQESLADGETLTPEQRAAALEDSVAAAQNTLNQLLELRLPLGWTYRTPDSVSDNLLGIYDPMTDSRNLYTLLPTSGDWLGNVAAKVAGLLITAIAVAQGAPFWFDILRRLTGGKSDSK